jgi:cytochrome c oxidase assembly protein subunit 11
MRHTDLSLKLVLITVAMFGFGFALVPIYDVFCEVTGFGGRTASTAEIIIESPVTDRSVRLEFVASVNRGAGFEFEPTVSSLQIQPGRVYETAYFARNLRNEAVVSQSVPSVAPGLAAQYLKKIECFCFTEQTLKAGETASMPVTYFIDPKIADDPNLDDVSTITLSYTFFPSDEPVGDADPAS